ncbi:MAG: hypothetical protein SFU55_08655 [Methylophilus sp.]|nr:hypothetical protein [Methylophilus sp.]
MNIRITKSLNSLAFSALPFTLSQSESLVSKYFVFDTKIYLFLFIIGCCLSAIALVTLLKEFYEYVISSISEVKYDCESIQYGEIEGFLNFLKEIFKNDQEFPSLERVQSWHKKNNQIIYYIIKTQTIFSWKVKLRIGCFSILPLNEIAVEKLNENKLVGKEITDDYIVPKNLSPAGFYIGVIAAKKDNKYYGNYTTFNLQGNIKAKHEMFKVPIFARPITKEGERLIKLHNFVPCKTKLIDEVHDVIYKKE